MKVYQAYELIRELYHKYPNETLAIYNDEAYISVKPQFTTASMPALLEPSDYYYNQISKLEAAAQLEIVDRLLAIRKEIGNPLLGYSDGFQFRLFPLEKSFRPVREFRYLPDPMVEEPLQYELFNLKALEEKRMKKKFLAEIYEELGEELVPN